MQFIQEELIIDTKDSVQLINITQEIEDIITKHDIVEGLVNISTKHTTTSIIINEDEEGLKRDIISCYEKIVPPDNYHHNRIDNNATSHIKAVLSAPNQTLPITDGKLNLGIWQSIFFVEYDGPRHNRQVTITIIK